MSASPQVAPTVPGAAYVPGGAYAGERTGSTASALRATAIGFSIMRRYPGRASAFLIATAAQGALQGLLVWVLRDILIGFGEAGHAGLRSMALGAATVFGVWLLRAASAFAGEVLTTALAYRAEADSIERVLTRMLTLSVRFFERSGQGDLVLASLSDLKAIRSVTHDVGNIVLHATRLAGLAIVAWLMSPKLMLIGVVLVPLGFLPAHWMGERITRAARVEREITGALYDHYLQVASGIRVVKVNLQEPRVLAHTRAAAQALYRTVVHQAVGKAVARLMFEAVSGLGLVLVLVVGGRDVAAGVLPWQSLLSLLVAILAVYAPMVGLLQVWAGIRTVLPHLERVDEMMAERPEVQDQPDARRLIASPGTITLDGVHFRYDARPVLEDVSATFHRGETIGIVGPSGSGKSTLIALLLRLYDPTGGRILVDGVDLREVRHADLCALSAIVSQEPFLFVDTVASNIRIGRPDATIEEVMDAARAANVHDEIMQMDHGYDTVLGRRRDARGLSVGQKQRVCIAAALLKNAPLLFLDEATSNLDSVSERAVQDAIERLMVGRTTFVVAHRLSTLRAVDRILVLEKGRVVGLGTHAELIGGCATYRKLWRFHRGDGEGAGTDGDRPRSSRRVSTARRA